MKLKIKEFLVSSCLISGRSFNLDSLESAKIKFIKNLLLRQFKLKIPPENLKLILVLESQVNYTGRMKLHANIVGFKQY